ncbi:EF-hand domain-containing protein [Saccharothrix sp. NPDC042600]|uniref:EF-hand domain-containing protein n=1 Tax=Saccharothrix TaxID=2071 RepID=UPI0033F38592|nr:calcium binding protein CalD [Saccharothrix mutabilis subsp. capreolus]
MTVINDAYTAKMSARFATFDRDHDGRIDVADFEGMAHAVLAACGRGPHSPEGMQLVEGARAFFRGLADIADTDGDGTISEAEFVHAARTELLGDRDGFTRIVLPWAQAVVAVADTDGDGAVDLAEWANVLVAMGATAQCAEQQAQHVDADGDGEVTLAEVLDTAVTFYTADEAGHEFDHA